MPAAVEGSLDDFVGDGEGLIDLACLVDALEAEVVAQLRVDHGGGGRKRRFHVRDGCKGRVVDAHAPCRILGRSAALGDHGGNGLAGPRGALERQGTLWG